MTLKNGMGWTSSKFPTLDIGRELDFLAKNIDFGLSKIVSSIKYRKKSEHLYVMYSTRMGFLKNIQNLFTLEALVFI